MFKHVIALILVLAAGSSAFGATWYVDKDNASGTQNGTSWQTAFTTVQPGIDAAFLDGGGEVWVAEGVYDERRETPMHNPPIDTGSLLLRGNVLVYGGFAGNETDRADRDYHARVTVIDGRIARGRSAAYHVVVGADDAVLDGFTVTGGNAKGGGEASNGGGVYNMGVSPSIKNCEIVSNLAEGSGGGIYNDLLAEPELTNCTVSFCLAMIHGGGMVNLNGASPAVLDCRFTGNEASQGGGGAYNGETDASYSACAFDGNEAPSGGGMFNDRYASPEVDASRFASNNADSGGGMFNDESLATVTGCTFESNRAEKRGGGMGSAGHAIVTVTGCIFSGNEAAQGGAMSNEDEATPTVTNCVFDANVAGADGGAMYNYYSAPRIANCTFTQNEAQGGGAVSNDEATPRLANCILWDDKPNEIDNGEKAAAPEAKRGAIITYSDVMGGYAGEANIDADPLFADPETGDYRITAQSPCINTGVAAEAPETDIRGIERPQGALPDMGAYEYNTEDPDRPAGDRPGCFGGTIAPPSGPSDSVRGTLVMMAVAAAILFLGGRRMSRHHTAIH